MVSTDVPPPHVPSFVMPVSNVILQVAGTLWTICYILLVWESLRSHSYGMPLFALAVNLSWEVVFAFYVTEAWLEYIVFMVWLVIDCGLIYGLLKYGRNEWSHAPFIAQNLGKFFIILTIAAGIGHFTFAKWWIDNEIGKRDGKFYYGAIGPDTSELGFWTAEFSQIYLSASSVIQLITRQHSGGVNYGVWFARSMGSFLGLTLNYFWGWYFWREAHEYFMNPFAVFLWSTGLICDVIYPFILWKVRQTENVLEDGTKIARCNQDFKHIKDKSS